MAGPKSKADLSGLTVAELDKRIGSLLARYEAAERLLVTTAAERRSLALAASAGEPEALARLAVLNGLTVEASAGQDMLKAALEECSNLRRAAVAGVADRQEQSRRTEAQEVAAEALAAAHACDKAMRELAAAFARRKALAMRLQALGERVPRLILTDAATRAARAHGLHAYMAIQHASPQHCAPLAIQDGPVLPLANNAGDVRQSAAA